MALAQAPRPILLDQVATNLRRRLNQELEIVFRTIRVCRRPVAVPTIVWTRRRIRCSWLQIIGGYAGVLDGGKDVESMVYHGDLAWTGPRLG